MKPRVAWYLEPLVEKWERRITYFWLTVLGILLALLVWKLS